MEYKRAVITGLGAITPVGNTLDEYWNGLISGVSGSNMITRFDASNFKTKFACELKDYDPLKYFDRKTLKKLDFFSQYAMISASEAVEDSELVSGTFDPDRIGVIFTSGIGGLNIFEEQMKEFFLGDGTPKFNPYFIPKMIIDIASGHISMKYNFRGPNYAPVSACASSTHALIDAFNYIRMGKADAIVTGGCEACVTIGGIGGFNAMKALSERNDEYKTASRPFDKSRDGFVMGEGSGALIVEELEHAKKRGAKIYAEIIGGGATADAYHLTAPHPEGLGAKHVMIKALEDANIGAEEVSYINVHGTSTPLGDIAELIAIQDVFGDNAYNINISSTKSMTGHLLGAAGAIESIACVKAIHDNIVPPTINNIDLDEQIDPKLNLTLNNAQEKNVNVALCNTFGFGGHNATVILRKFEG